MGTDLLCYRARVGMFYTHAINCKTNLTTLEFFSIMMVRYIGVKSLPVVIFLFMSQISKEDSDIIHCTYNRGETTHGM